MRQGFLVVSVPHAAQRVAGLTRRRDARLAEVLKSLLEDIAASAAFVIDSATVTGGSGVCLTSYEDDDEPEPVYGRRRR